MLSVIVKRLVWRKFRVQWKDLVRVEPLLWATFVPTIHPDGDTSKKCLSNIYCELTNREKLKTIATKQL